MHLICSKKQYCIFQVEAPHSFPITSKLKQKNFCWVVNFITFPMIYSLWWLCIKWHIKFFFLLRTPTKVYHILKTRPWWFYPLAVLSNGQFQWGVLYDIQNDLACFLAEFCHFNNCWPFKAASHPVVLLKEMQPSLIVVFTLTLWSLTLSLPRSN